MKPPGAGGSQLSHQVSTGRRGRAIKRRVCTLWECASVQSHQDANRGDPLPQFHRRHGLHESRLRPQPVGLWFPGLPMSRPAMPPPSRVVSTGSGSEPHQPRVTAGTGSPPSCPTRGPGTWGGCPRPRSPQATPGKAGGLDPKASHSCSVGASKGQPGPLSPGGLCSGHRGPRRAWPMNSGSLSCVSSMW